jgi:pimeloyl-ACP methyl ester carboxylesterase
MGAGVALRTAAEDSRIKALVLEAPYNDLHQTAAILLKRYRIPASKLFASRVLKRAKRLTGVSLHKPRPIDAATRVKIPTLIIRGTHDALVSANETKYLASQLNGLVENIEIEGARHSKVLDVGGPALIEQIGEFLDRTSNSR